MLVLTSAVTWAQTTKPTSEKLTIQVVSTPLTASAHHVDLSCTAPGGNVTGFYFYRGTTVGGESATPLNATPTAACAYTDAQVTGLTTYYYTAKSYCPTCNPTTSGPSNEAQAVIPADPAPNPPTGLTVGTIAMNQVPLFWNQPVPQDGFTLASYRVYRGANPTMPKPSLIAKVSPVLQTYTDLHCKATCYYYVKAYDKLPSGSYGLSAPSNIVKAVN